MKTLIHDGKTYAQITDLKQWDKNPREINDEERARLLAVIEKRGQRQPLQVNSGEFWGEAGQLLGGNHRVGAYQSLGITEVWVNLNSPKDEAEAISLAFEDNEQFARYVVEEVANLLAPYRGTDLEQLRLSITSPARASAIMDTFLEPTAPPQMNGGDSPTPNGTNGGDRQSDAPPRQDAAGYANAAVKQIVLYFPSEQYDMFIDELEEIKAVNDLKNNTEAMLWLLKYYKAN